MIVDRSWIEIDLDALKKNLQNIRSLLSPSCQLMGVVKADAYGHGAAAVATCMEEAGLSYLAVSLLDEAIELRRKGIKLPILILSYTDPRRAKEVVQGGFHQAAYSFELLDALAQAARELGQKARIHIKLDTGMGRIGFQTSYRSVKEIEGMMQMPELSIEGIFTHFSTADEETEAGKAYLHRQFEQFFAICKELEQSGYHIPLKHCCNSAATLACPAYHLDMVRPGGLCYGLLPANVKEEQKALFQPVLSLHSTVIHQKWVEAGQALGYNRSYVAKERRRILTVPIGYADGLSRLLSGRLSALLRGQKIPQIASICMDASLFDATALPEDCELGEELVLIGRQQTAEGRLEIQAKDLAQELGSINYEITSTLGKRLPRVYKQGGKTVAVDKVLLA